MNNSNNGNSNNGKVNNNDKDAYDSGYANFIPS